MNETHRLDAVDVARGVALVAMAGYHFTWDLAWFGVVAPSTPFTPPMRIASHVIGVAFLGLAGLSLALAHGGGFRPRAFVKRFVRIAAAAALVSAASYAMAPTTPIFFGILHCLLAASLLAAPFLWLSRPASPSLDKGGGDSGGVAALAVGAAMIAAPSLFASTALNSPWTVWLGLGTQEPPTLDWRPLMPWGGFVLVGLGLTRLYQAVERARHCRRGLQTAQPAAGRDLEIAATAPWRAKSAPLRGLAFAGRHSLAVYLIHQPILIGLLYGALQVSGYSETLSVQAYDKACRPACVEAGGEIDACDRACACVVRDASAAGLAGRLGSRSISSDERARISGIVNACGEAR